MKASSQSWIERLLQRALIEKVNFLVFVAAVALFLFIAHEVSEGDHLPVEIEIMRTMREAHWSGTWGREIARDVTALGSMVVLTTLTLLVAGFLALTRRFGATLFLLTAAIGGQSLNSFLKGVYGRERPDPTLRWIEIDSLSFPSGHATSSAVVYLTLAVLLTRLAEKKRERTYLFAAALLLIALVGISRIYLGVHYPTDVIAGWTLGIAWAEICWFAARLIGQSRLRAGTP